MKKRLRIYCTPFLLGLYLLIVTIVVVGCQTEEIIPIPPLNTVEPGLAETASKETEILSTATLEQSKPSPTPILDATTSILTVTPVTESVITNPITHTIPSIDVETSLCQSNLKPVFTSESNWAAIIKRAEQLQGSYSLALSPNGHLFAAVETDPDDPQKSYLYLWEVDTGDMIWFVEPDENIAATEIAFSPDGTLLVTGASDAKPNVFVWDVATGNLIHKLPYNGYTTNISFSSDNKYLVVGGLYPTTAIAWNLEDGSVIEISNGNGAVFVPNSTEPILIAFKMWRRQQESSPIFLLNLLTGDQEYLFPGTSSVDGAAISSNGKLISTVVFEDEFGSLRIFDLQEKMEISVENSKLDYIQVNQISFSSTDNLGVLQGELKIWDATGNFVACLDEPDVDGFIFTPDGSYLLTYGRIKTPLKIWEIPTN